MSLVGFEILAADAARADEAGRETMRRAFLASAAHEEAFFAEPIR
ncbi:hypothetical protein ACQ3HE_15185 [Plantibacter auratus]